MDPDPGATAAPLPPLPPGVAFELPTARQVVGRGLQLALDGNREIRNVSLYIGLMVLAVAGPAALLVIVDLPRLFEIPWQLPQVVTPDEAAELLTVLGPLYVVGALALLGLITVSIDGELMAAAILAGRAAGRPLTLRESLQRARQVFWRYGFAAFAVGILSTIVSALVGWALGSLGHADSGAGSLGHADSGAGSLIGTFVATLAVAPFGYILTAIVIGDADAGAALGRSVTLARARPSLAVVVAAFAFLANTLQVFGVGAAFEVVDRVATFLHPQLDMAGSGIVVAIVIVAIALVAFGSLGLTVGAVTAAPQISAFLGLTHYSAGLDKARTTVPATKAETSVPVAGAASTAAPDNATTLAAEVSKSSPSQWVRPAAAPAQRTRWVTIPMLVLIVLEALTVASGIAAVLGR